MDRTLRMRFGLIAVLVFGAAALRLIPHPPNFVPVAAIALFGGALFDRKCWAFVVPLAAMVASDAVLYPLHGYRFDVVETLVIYLSFAAIVGVGLLLRGRRGVASVTIAAVSSSTLFFLTTNLAVWAFSGWYPPTAAGLGACFVAAIPFYGLSLAGDLFYASILFGGFALAERRFPVLALPRTA
jgi:hypothetical protein